MSDAKISALTSITGASVVTSTDVLAIVDTSASQTKKILVDELFKSNQSTNWTPALTFATPGDISTTYTTQIGRYIQMGSLYFISFSIVTSSFTYTTASGNAVITGLPATVLSLASFIPAFGVQWSGITKANYTQITAYPESNTTRLALRASGSGQGISQMTTTDFPTAGTYTLNGSFAYIAA